MMNNKILSVVLVLGIASTGFAAISSAADTGTGTVKTEMKQLFEKLKSGETLSAEEQAELDAAKAQFPGRGGKHGVDGFGKRAGFTQLTDAEKTALESMTDTEKKAFFDAKKSEMEVQRTAHKAVIDTLIAGGKLTADQEATRLEMLAKFETEATNTDHPARVGADIIKKLVAGDALTDTEKTELTKMQELHATREAEKVKIDAMSESEREAYFEAKKAEMDAKMEVIKPLLKKQKAGETLTSDEQAQLDAFKAEHPMMKEGKGGHKGAMMGRGHGPDMDGDFEGAREE